MTDYSKYLGIKWIQHGRSLEEGLDCIGLVLLVEKECYGRDLYALDHAYKEHWAKDNPKELEVNASACLPDSEPMPLIEGDVVLFAIKYNRETHCGIYVGDGKFLHTTANTGSVITSLSANGREFWQKRLTRWGAPINVLIDPETGQIPPRIKGPVAGAIAAVTAFMGTTAVTVAGYAVTYGALLKALFWTAAIGGAIYSLSNKPKKPKFKSESPSYSFSGPITTALEGGAVPIIYGKASTGGVLIDAYTQVAEGTVDEQQNAYMLFLLGEGEVENLEEIWVGDERIYWPNASDGTNRIDITVGGVLQGARSPTAGSVYTDYYNSIVYYWYKGLAAAAANANRQAPVNFGLVHNRTDNQTGNVMVGNAVPDTFQVGPFDSSNAYKYLTKCVVGFQVDQLFKMGKKGTKKTPLSWTVDVTLDDNSNFLTPLGTYSLYTRVKENETGNFYAETHITINATNFPGFSAATAYYVRVAVTRHTQKATSKKLKGPLRMAYIDILQDYTLKGGAGASAFLYPRSSIVSVAAIPTSKFSGGIPSWRFVVKGKKVQFVNLLPGDTTRAWSDNPADCLYDLLTSERDGLGAWITSADINLASFQAAKTFCDANITGVDGSASDRHRLNLVIDAAGDPYELIDMMTRPFGLTLVIQDGVYKLKVEQSGAATATYTDGSQSGWIDNIKLGSLSVHLPEIEAIPTVIEVQYYDEDHHYELRTVTAHDYRAVGIWGLRKQQVEARGITRKWEAENLALKYLRYARYIDHAVTFSVGLKSFASEISDVIIIKHTAPNWTGTDKLFRITDVALNLYSTPGELSLDIAASRYAGEVYAAYNLGLPTES